MHYFDAATYANLYNILSEMDTDTAATFASFFSLDENGYYVVTSETAYISWLSESLFDGGDPDSDWISWSGTLTGKSTQWSGND